MVVEYVEIETPTTDARGPVFRQMTDDACTSPPPYDAIILNFRSIFRDVSDLGRYENYLDKYGVRLLLANCDPGNIKELARNILAIFDGYRRSEHAKVTLQGLKDNACCGYFNGSKPPFGFSSIEIEATVQKTATRKKRLVIKPEEAAVVRQIFELFTNEGQVQPLDTTQIAAQLNKLGITRRGTRWSKKTVADLLRNSAYAGRYYFNTRSAKTRALKDREEWIPVEVPAIVDQSVFAKASQLLKQL